MDFAPVRSKQKLEFPASISDHSRPLNSNRSSTPAIVLGMLVPGAGHFYAGRSGAALVWFAAVTIISFAGWTLVGPSFYSSYGMSLAFGGRTFGIPLAIPEIANFLESFVVYNWLARPIIDAPIPASAPFGYVLTAMGGIVNLIACADAHFYCKNESLPAGKKSPAIAALFAWFIPGAGHLYLGRRGKALLGFSALLLTFIIGAMITRGTSPQRDRDLYFWSGEILLGLPAAAATIIQFGRRIQSELPLGEMGLLFTTVAGLLNVLFILDAYATAERDIHAPAPADAPADSPSLAAIR